MSTHPLLRRQIRRCFGVDSVVSLVQAVADASNDSAARSDLATRLHKLSEMVCDSYSQSDRDLDLRSRSLALSSQELTQANQHLRDEADRRQQALDALQVTTRTLLTDLDLPQADDLNNNLLGLAQLLRDLVQQRSEALREAERTRAQLHSAIEALDVGFIMFDDQDRLVVCNRKFREVAPLPCLLGKPTYSEFVRALYRSEVAGVDRSLPEDQFVQQHQALYAALVDGPRTREVNGGGGWVRLDESRSPDGLTVTLRTDISASKQAALELLQAKQAAEAASVAKTRFLANMSHELRTPLNAVMGAAQLLANDNGDASSRTQLLDTIQRSGLDLLGSIENILDLSRLEVGECRLAQEDFHLVDCTEAAMATVAVAARAKGLALACVIDPNLPAWRNGDPLRLRQVLLNLLSNAVKFTTAGEVVLRVQRVGDDKTHADELLIIVSDTGVGIEEAARPHIFKAFRQGDDSAIRRFGGSGLGLAIVQRVVQVMGGSIDVRSALGQGTSVEVRLSLPPARCAQPAAPPLGVPIAYFEPHDASAEGLAAQLQRMGCPSHRVRSSAALHQWLTEQPGLAQLPWLLVACDDGQAWDLLENSAKDLKPEQVIGMTRAEAADIDLVREDLRLPRNIIKPVLRSALVSRLGVLRTGQPAQALVQALAPRAAAQAATGKHILVVEDDLLNQTIVCQMLGHAGYQTSAASDGAQALAMLRQQHFDLALMDWQMPDMDGLEVTRRIRQGRAGEEASRMHIVALTANAYAEDRTACLAAGMNDFLTKPVLADRLLATIQHWTGQTATRCQAPPPSQASPNEPDLAVQPERPDPAMVYDPSVLAALPMVADGSDPGYAEELLKMFMQSASTTLERLESALSAQDMGAVQGRAHTLKSSAAQVGALALSAAAARIESTLRRGGRIDANSAPQLRQHLEQFEHTLAANVAKPSGTAATTQKGKHDVQNC